VGPRLFTRCLQRLAAESAWHAVTCYGSAESSSSAIWRCMFVVLASCVEVPLCLPLSCVWEGWGFRG
jgi:hypothetical protein